MSFLVASVLGAYILFTAISSTAEVNGPAYSLGGGIAGFFVIFVLLDRSFNRIARGYPKSAPPLDEEKQDKIFEDGVRKFVKDDSRVKEIVKSIEEAYITIDASSFLGASGASWRVPFDQFASAQELINTIWSYLPHNVARAYSYGKDWLLVNAETGIPLRDLGRQGGKLDDNRKLQEIGVGPGTRLLVVTPSLEQRLNEVEILVRRFNGQKVPGRLLGVDGEVTLPYFSKISKNYRLSLSGRAVYADVDLLAHMQGSLVWAIEVKTGPAHGPSTTARLKTISEAVKGKGWLVQFSKLNPTTRREAELLNLYVTGKDEFQEFASLLSAK